MTRNTTQHNTYFDVQVSQFSDNGDFQAFAIVASRVVAKSDRGHSDASDALFQLSARFGPKVTDHLNAKFK